MPKIERRRLKPWRNLPGDEVSLVIILCAVAVAIAVLAAP